MLLEKNHFLRSACFWNFMVATIYSFCTYFLKKCKSIDFINEGDIRFQWLKVFRKILRTCHDFLYNLNKFFRSRKSGCQGEYEQTFICRNKGNILRGFVKCNDWKSFVRKTKMKISQEWIIIYSNSKSCIFNITATF